MPKFIKIISLPVFAILAIIIVISINYNEQPETGERYYKKMKPADWFYLQRAYPLNDIPYDKFFASMDEKKIMEEMNDSPLDLTWAPKGPYNIGGRISATVVDPANTNIIITGGAAGGILKTTNGGLNWTAKTDNWPSLSVGALIMDPNNSNIIYCGTGEANSAIDNYPGFGILKSTDKGDTWNLIGLTQALHIGNIDIYPGNSNLMYSAVMGFRSFSQNKGIYKSTNAGLNWERVLFVSDSTSGIDVKISPDDQNLVYAAMWERVRTPPSISKTGGITSGLYRSSNGGANWTLLGASNGLPAPAANIGRISVAVSRSNPNYVYSIYKNASNNNILGIYKSTNKGLNWSAMGTSGVSSSGFDWYFGLIEVDPTNPNTVFIGSIDIFKTTNGSSWVNLTNSYSGTFEQQHPDQHTLWINPSNVNHMINGNDGGIFTSTSGGAPWTKSHDLPITQYYASTIDYLQPQRKLGGSQDNGSYITYNGGLDNWDMIYGGDGFTTLVDYTNSSIIYCESQNGGLGRSTNNGSSFVGITTGLSGRFNWHTPYVMDIQDPNTLYVGSHMLFKTTNRGTNWTAISSDLTRGQNGRLGTITCISSAVLPSTQRVIYVGTDDSKVSVSTNGGAGWADVTGSLPQRYMTDVLCDKRNPAIAYLTLSGFNVDESNTRVFRTTNYGTNWINISGNLLNAPVNSVIIDYTRDSVLYIGCDAGVYFTTNLGSSWNLLGSGLPNSPVVDLNYHQPAQILCAATHGRSLYEISVAVLPIGINNNSETAVKYKLGQNYPNPFNPVTQINYSVPEAAYVNISVYDLAGRFVRTLVNKNMRAGEYSAVFDGNGLASGIYFYTMKTGEVSVTKKMVMIK